MPLRSSLKIHGVNGDADAFEVSFALDDVEAQMPPSGATQKLSFDVNDLKTSAAVSSDIVSSELASNEIVSSDIVSSDIASSAALSDTSAAAAFARRCGAAACREARTSQAARHLGTPRYDVGSCSRLEGSSKGTFQMSWAYSLTVRSEENHAIRAMLSMLARIQSKGDSHSFSTRLCVAQ